MDFRCGYGSDSRYPRGTIYHCSESATDSSFTIQIRSVSIYNYPNPP
ncbi:hypothetical protein CCACVL1_09385 [Corchorus capsularis]|uniref:Uncharacterized protein n=1 Tax=Corchorus capsularis TaxID=210143 RepID=A0A1R3IWF9_COCAP|nr:hypothetical protein CCACVL1_09385 [Corchorus capsularis]